MPRRSSARRTPKARSSVLTKAPRPTSGGGGGEGAGCGAGVRGGGRGGGRPEGVEEGAAREAGVRVHFPDEDITPRCESFHRGARGERADFDTRLRSAASSAPRSQVHRESLDSV